MRSVCLGAGALGRSELATPKVPNSPSVGQDLVHDSRRSARVAASFVGGSRALAEDHTELLDIDVRVDATRQFRVSVTKQPLKVDEADAPRRVPARGGVPEAVDVEFEPLIVNARDSGGCKQPIEDPHHVVRRLAPHGTVRRAEDRIAG